MVDNKLKDKVVLITGINNPYGVGAAAAKAFAAEEAKIFGTYLPLPPKTVRSGPFGLDLYEALITQAPDEVIAAVRKLGGAIEVVEADLADPAIVPGLFDWAERALGGVDVLVNNAAYDASDSLAPQNRAERGNKTVWEHPISAISADSHDRHFSVNSRAVALMMAEFASRFQARGADGGRIINVSTDGASGFPTEASYGASKHAMESYSRAAAWELGRWGITVNVVSLGAIQTGWISAATPLGRIGKPEDVADVILFLASDQARWITGQMIYVGGGHQMPL